MIIIFELILDNNYRLTPYQIIESFYFDSNEKNITCLLENGVNTEEIEQYYTDFFSINGIEYQGTEMIVEIPPEKNCIILNFKIA